jgi:hypothetical protein
MQHCSWVFLWVVRSVCYLIMSTAYHPKTAFKNGHAPSWYALISPVDFFHSHIFTKPSMNEIACPTVRYDYTQT